MANVKVCEHAGFCFGAGRGVDLLEEALTENIPIYTYGPILNNDKLVEGFSKRGVKVINDLDDLKTLPKGKVIIRAHGIAKNTYEKLQNTGFEIVDATCPFVKRIHKIVEKQSELKEQIVVIGNPLHPEVKGIVGWSKTPAVVVETEDQANKFCMDKDIPLCIVSQTTFHRTKFEELVAIFRKNSYNINVMNTICDATRIRQEEADDLAKQADVMIVIGDEKSSNSRKLYDICKANCESTYFIQTVSDIKGRLLPPQGLIGITAGASTPKYIIEEVQSYVRNDV